MSQDAAPLPDDVTLCHQIIRGLQREVAELNARLNQNSSNSSKPASSDPPSVKRAPPKRPTAKKRGGQRGRKRRRRDLVPPEKVAASFDIKQESSLWTFVWVEGIEPTNNDAERVLRHAVLWRKFDRPLTCCPQTMRSIG